MYPSRSGASVIFPQSVSVQDSQNAIAVYARLLTEGKGVSCGLQFWMCFMSQCVEYCQIRGRSLPVSCNADRRSTGLKRAGDPSFPYVSGCFAIEARTVAMDLPLRSTHWELGTCRTKFTRHWPASYIASFVINAFPSERLAIVSNYSGRYPE
jgi:hypothetical protein